MKKQTIITLIIVSAFVILLGYRFVNFENTSYLYLTEGFCKENNMNFIEEKDTIFFEHCTMIENGNLRRYFLEKRQNGSLFLSGSHCIGEDCLS